MLLLLRSWNVFRIIAVFCILLSHSETIPRTSFFHPPKIFLEKKNMLKARVHGQGPNLHSIVFLFARLC